MKTQTWGTNTPGVYIDPSFPEEARKLIAKALEEWASTDSVAYPASGQHNAQTGKPNPQNDASDAVMDRGSKEVFDNYEKGKVRRSFTTAEKNALRQQYGGQFKPTVVGSANQAQVVIKPAQQPNGRTGQSVTTVQGNQVKRVAITIAVTPTRASGAVRPWFYAGDTDGDGMITNADAGPPDGQFDFYSSVKHELGHAFTFRHSGPSNVMVPEWRDDAPRWAGELRGVLWPGNDRGAALGEACLAEHAASLYFASDRPGGHGGYDIWRVSWDGEAWIEPQNLGPSINTSSNESDPFIWLGESELFFASDRGGDWDLYVCHRDEAMEWAPAEGLGELNTAWQESAPSVHPDGHALTFSSDRPGGRGGLDLWSSVRDTEGWAWLAPMNLGPTVNSAQDDDDAAFAPDGVLYFSSDRPGGSGGFDIWTAEYEDAWLEPENAGSEVNLGSNEVDPCVSSGSEYLFLSTDSSWGGEVGGFDLYTLVDIHPRMYVYDEPDPVEAGELVTCTIALVNDTGYDVYHTMVVTATYGHDLTFVSAHPKPEAGTEDRWVLTELRPGERGVVQVVLRAASNLPFGYTPQHSTFGGQMGDGVGVVEVEGTTVFRLCQVYLPIVGRGG